MPPQRNQPSVPPENYPNPYGFPAAAPPQQPGVELPQPVTVVQPPGAPQPQQPVARQLPPEATLARNPGPYYQQPKPAPEPEATPYDFFLEPQQKPKKKAIKVGSKFNKILLIVGGLVVVMMAIIIITNLTQSSNKQAAAEFNSIATNQQEIIRVSNLGMLHVGSDSLKNFSSTAIADMTSSQLKLIDYADKNGVNIDTKLLAASSNPRIDKSLDAAEAASTYDSTFQALMQELLKDHQTKLEQIQKTATAPTERTILSNDLASDLLLQQMLNQ
jgi:GrpB-like predicted nucleotidyltransferase (UPF0157 family)